MENKDKTMMTIEVSREYADKLVARAGELGVSVGQFVEKLYDYCENDGS